MQATTIVLAAYIAACCCHGLKQETYKELKKAAVQRNKRQIFLAVNVFSYIVVVLLWLFAGRAQFSELLQVPVAKLQGYAQAILNWVTPTFLASIGLFFDAHFDIVCTIRYYGRTSAQTSP